MKWEWYACRYTNRLGRSYNIFCSAGYLLWFGTISVSTYIAKNICAAGEFFWDSSGNPYDFDHSEMDLEQKPSVSSPIIVVFGMRNFSVYFLSGQTGNQNEVKFMEPMEKHIISIQLAVSAHKLQCQFHAIAPTFCPDNRRALHKVSWKLLLCQMVCGFLEWKIHGEFFNHAHQFLSPSTERVTQKSSVIDKLMCFEVLKTL